MVDGGWRRVKSRRIVVSGRIRNGRISAPSLITQVRGRGGNKIIRMFEIDQARVSYFTIICGSSRVTRVTVLFAKSLIYLNKTKCRWNL